MGKIKNFHEEYTFAKGEEKRERSCLVVARSFYYLRKIKVQFSEKYFEDTKVEKETLVKMGEKIGESM